ncbi:hypothetical protein BCR32DRAFT_243203 [Anaeromyces robustus]|uniref:Uncharacterized protein n=1 Tax=Anaeromyces robustus TaxID=1754192 RepID=A0A1Y1XD19_9FUNG|nr:hypothetical protein BCR32DRAFT_243203 [Anaeromyces robustus]|eukprot:ORX83670.1 hypothetical protein BCR32DRAFT_243203 [Anaeromyces robustus]
MKFIYLYCFIISTFLFSGVISVVDNVDRRCVERVNAKMRLYYYNEDRKYCSLYCNLKRTFITKYCATTNLNNRNGERDTCYKANQKCKWGSTNFCEECIINVYKEIRDTARSSDFGLLYNNIEAVSQGRSFPRYECFCTARSQED